MKSKVSTTTMHAAPFDWSLGAHAPGLPGGCKLPMQFHDVPDDPGGDKEFRSTLLKGVEDIRTEQKSSKSQIDELTKNYDQLHKDTKDAFEELTKVKNDATRIDEVELNLKKVRMQLANEQRMAFGDPVERIKADEEMRTKINAIARAYTKTPMTEAHQKALGEDSSPGSTIIDDDLANAIYDTFAQYGVWNTFDVWNLGTKITKFPVATEDPVCSVILSEGGSIPDDTNMAGTTVSAEVEILATLINVSKQLLEDSEFDVTGIVLRAFARATAKRMDFLTLVADGTADATNGGMTGIFEGGTAATAASGNTTMEALDFEDFTNVLLTPDEGVLDGPCGWWMHPHILIRCLHVKDGNGRPIFLTATEAPTRGGIGGILGYPVNMAYVAPKTNTAGNPVAAFGDPLGMVAGIRQDFEFEMSDHARWTNYQRSFRGVARFAAKLKKATAIAVLTLAGS